MPLGGDIRRPGADAAAGRVSASSGTVGGNTARVRPAAPGAISALTRRSKGRGAGPRSSLAGGAARPSARRVSIVTLALVALLGVAYLSARGYLTLPRASVGRGIVVIESRPAGVEVFVEGRASGRTPATLDLQAGEHTVVLRAGRGITLVPIVAVSGTRRVERVDIRPSPPPRRAPAAAPPVTLPVQGDPQ
jgi:hypothetical protein